VMPRWILYRTIKNVYPSGVQKTDKNQKMEMIAREFKAVRSDHSEREVKRERTIWPFDDNVNHILVVDSGCKEPAQLHSWM